MYVSGNSLHSLSLLKII